MANKWIKRERWQRKKIKIGENFTKFSKKCDCQSIKSSRGTVKPLRELQCKGEKIRSKS